MKSRPARPLTVALLALASPLSSAATLPGDITLDRAPKARSEASRLGERLFYETRFAEYFRSHNVGVNRPLPQGDPVLRHVVLPGGATAPHPYAGRSMNCAACHFSDELAELPDGGPRDYTDFVARSPIPERGDGRTRTLRQTQSLRGLFEGDYPRGLLHWDGEFASAEALVAAGFTGRNFGWLPSERAEAVAHFARVLREDDGRDPLGRNFGGTYARTWSSPTLPASWRLDVASASDERLLEHASKLVSLFMQELGFARDSAYDAFLARNGLPTRPEGREGNLGYARRLRGLIARLDGPAYVPGFGARELEGLRLFLAEPAAAVLTQAEIEGGRVGNCLACHAPPDFSDGGLHNIGSAQQEHDATHGRGAFAGLELPDAARKRQDPILEPYRSESTDLGLWLVLFNPAQELASQHALGVMCRQWGRGCRAGGESDDALLELAVGAFKTPVLRNLARSQPYLHSGRFTKTPAVVAFYWQRGPMARAGQLRAADPEMQRIALNNVDVMPLAAFLDALKDSSER